jgi:RecB family exonuclease
VRHLSATSIGMVMRCPEQFRRRYILGMRSRPGGAMVVGSACHGALEHNFRQKLETGADLPEADVLDAYAAAWDASIDESGGESEVEWSEKPARAKDRGAAMTRAYRTAGAPRIQPERVERSFRLDVTDVPVPVVGRTDVEGKLVIDGTAIHHGIVFDMKFGGRVPSRLEPPHRLQGLIYALARRRHAHFHVTGATLKVALAPETPLVVPFDVAAERAALVLIQRAAQTITSLYSRYGPDAPWPGALAHSWACGYCGWRESCIYWSSSA